jgi:hypothetical protein
MHRRPSRLRRVVIAILLGVATTVAVSWLAMFLPSGAHGYGPRIDHDFGIATAPSIMKTFQISEGRNRWHHVVQYWWMQVSGQSMAMMDRDERQFDIAQLPSHLRPKSLDELMMLSWYREVGWPLPALTCAVHWKQQILNSNVIYRVEGGVQLPRDAEFNPRALPLRPLWPGFAMNTLLAAVAWWLVFWAVSSARRGWRRRRGRCLQCGYPRQGLAQLAACPECGCNQSQARWRQRAVNE